MHFLTKAAILLLFASAAVFASRCLGNVVVNDSERNGIVHPTLE